MCPPISMGVGLSKGFHRRQKTINLKIDANSSGSIRFTFFGEEKNFSGSSSEQTYTTIIRENTLVAGTFRNASADLKTFSPATSSQIVGSASFDTDTSGNVSFTLSYDDLSDGDTVEIDYTLDV
jgi:hypothetical protein